MIELGFEPGTDQEYIYITWLQGRVVLFIVLPSWFHNIVRSAFRGNQACNPLVNKNNSNYIMSNLLPLQVLLQGFFSPPGSSRFSVCKRAHRSQKSKGKREITITQLPPWGPAAPSARSCSGKWPFGITLSSISPLLERVSGWMGGKKIVHTLLSLLFSPFPVDFTQNCSASPPGGRREGHYSWNN